MTMNLRNNIIPLTLYIIVFFNVQTLYGQTVTLQPTTFNKGVSYNDIFVTSKVIETLIKLDIPFYVSNEGIVYVEEKNEKVIDVNDPTEGLGLTQFPELSKATSFMALLAGQNIEYFPAKSGDNKYYNIYYSEEDQEKISQYIMPVFIKATKSGLLFNYKKQ